MVSVAEVTAKPPPEKRFGFSKTNQVREFTRKSLVGESVVVGEVEMAGVVVEEGGEMEVVQGEHRDVLAGVWAVLGEEHSGPMVAGAVLEVEPQVPEVVQGEVHKVREVRVNTVLRTKRPALAKGGKGYRLLKTVVPKQGDDNLTFINGEVGPAKAPAWLQVDPGSDITCVLAEYVDKLGLQSKMVPRAPKDAVRVRGIGTEEGQGELITHDIWLSVRVHGREVVTWDVDTVLPVEGEKVDMLVEGWCAVLAEMSVPFLLGGDILKPHDTMDRPRAQRVVLDTGHAGRVSMQSYTRGAMAEAIRARPHAIYQSPVWRSLVGGVRGRDELVKQCHVQRTRVPPESSKTVKVRYNDGAPVSDNELFTVRVLKSELGDSREWDEGMKLKWTVGWDPSEGGEVCAGRPTVTVFNFTSQWLEVDPWDIRVEVCPMQEVIRFVSDAHYEGEAPPEVMAHSVKQESLEIERPAQFPEDLWDLVHPEAKAGVGAQFERFPPNRLEDCIQQLIYDLDVHADMRPVLVHPWLRRGPIQVQKERGEDATSAETGVVEDVHTTKAGTMETPQADVKDMEGLVSLTCEAGPSDAGTERRPKVPDGVTSTPGGTWIQPWTNLVRG